MFQKIGLRERVIVEIVTRRITLWIICFAHIIMCFHDSAADIIFTKGFIGQSLSYISYMIYVHDCTCYKHAGAYDTKVSSKSKYETYIKSFAQSLQDTRIKHSFCYVQKKPPNT